MGPSTAPCGVRTVSAATTEVGAKLVLVGDPAQIGVVQGPGGMLAHLTAQLPRIELTRIHRFTHDWEAAASLHLRDGDHRALAAYDRHGRIHAHSSGDDAADAVFEQWQTGTHSGRDVLMMARSWTDVTALSLRARAAAERDGQIHGPTLLDDGNRCWRAGDVLLTRRNNPRIRLSDGDQLRNGDRFTILAATNHGDLLVASRCGRGTTVLPADYVPFR